MKAALVLSLSLVVISFLVVLAAVLGLVRGAEAFSLEAAQEARPAPVVEPWRPWDDPLVLTPDRSVLGPVPVAARQRCTTSWNSWSRQWTTRCRGG
jgi:hypothetical protein